MFVAMCVFHGPQHDTLTSNVILTREITHFNVTGTVGTRLEIQFAWCDTAGGSSVDDEWNVRHPEVQQPESIDKMLAPIEVVHEVDRHFGFMVSINEVVVHNTADNSRVELT